MDGKGKHEPSVSNTMQNRLKAQSAIGIRVLFAINMKVLEPPRINKITSRRIN